MTIEVITAGGVDFGMLIEPPGTSFQYTFAFGQQILRGFQNKPVTVAKDFLWWRERSCAVVMGSGKSESRNLKRNSDFST